MKKSMGTDSLKCHAKPARLRALVSLAAPIVALGWAAHALISKGYDLTDYFTLVAGGEIDRISQVLGLVALIIWVCRYWPPAVEALSAACLVSSKDGDFALANGVRFPVAEVERIEKRHNLITKTLEFRLRDGSKHVQPVVFAAEAADEIRKALMGELDKLESARG